MGQSKKFADHFDRLADDRHIQRLVAKGGLQCLSPRELDLEHEPLTIDPEPKPVRAWVRFFEQPIWVQAWACRWTTRAVGIEFRAGEKRLTTWVWSDAVTPDSEPRVIPEDVRYGGKRIGQP